MPAPTAGRRGVSLAGGSFPPCPVVRTDENPWKGRIGI
jgi:hypothetical protein